MVTKKTAAVSVIIPGYNCEHTIEQAVESVLQQTWTDYELILVDDGSTDSTGILLEQMKETDPQIHVLHNQNNFGVSYSRNRGVDSAGADWIAFLDSDDLWKPEKLEKQIKIQRERNADIVYTGYDYMDAEGNPIDSVFHVPQELTYEQLLKQNVMSCSGILLKKQLLQEYRMEKDEVHEDFLEWLRLLRSGAYAIGIDEPLHTLRIAQKESKSGNKLKSAKMTYRTYQELGLSGLQILYYMGCYICRSLRKYGSLKTG